MNAHAPSDDNPDMILLRRIIAGDSAALESLYQRHGKAVLAYLIGQVGDRDLAEELLQDVMLAAWHGASKFRGGSQVRTWLLGIARYQAINARTRQQGRHPQPALLLREEEASGDVLDDAILRQAEMQDLRAAFAQLSEAHRETLELIFYHDLSGNDAAAVLGVAPGTVKSRIHRALAALKTLLTRNREESPNAKH